MKDQQNIKYQIPQYNLRSFKEDCYNQPKQAEPCSLKSKSSSSALSKEREALILKTNDPDRPFLVEAEWAVRKIKGTSQLSTNIRNNLGRRNVQSWVNETFLCDHQPKDEDWKLIGQKKLGEDDDKSQEVTESILEEERRRLGTLCLLNPPPGSQCANFSYYSKGGNKKGLTFVTVSEWQRVNQLGIFAKEHPDLKRLNSVIESVLAKENFEDIDPIQENAVDYGKVSPVTREKVLYGKFNYLEPKCNVMDSFEQHIPLTSDVDSWTGKEITSEGDYCRFQERTHRRTGVSNEDGLRAFSYNMGTMICEGCADIFWNHLSPRTQASYGCFQLLPETLGIAHDIRPDSSVSIIHNTGELHLPLFIVEEKSTVDAINNCQAQISYYAQSLFRRGYNFVICIVLAQATKQYRLIKFTNPNCIKKSGPVTFDDLVQYSYLVELISQGKIIEKHMQQLFRVLLKSIFSQLYSQKLLHEKYYKEEIFQ